MNWVDSIGNATELMFPHIVRQAKHDGIYLTFDDGPDEFITPQVLDILATHNAKATFFLNVNHLKTHKSIAPLYLQHQHSVGFHCYEHKSQMFMSKKKLLTLVKSGLDEIEQFTGIRSVLWRPPYGRFGVFHKKIAEDMGLKIVLWSCTAYDWVNFNPENLCHQLLSQIKNRDIILLHDNGKGAKNLTLMLSCLLPKLAQKGFIMKSLTDSPSVGK